MNKTSITVLIAVFALGGLWFALIPISSSGYGYHGYNGFHSHYGGGWSGYGNSTVYKEKPSARSGSLGGSSVSGGGLRGGK